MKGLQEYFVTYMMVQLIAVGFLFAAYKSTRLARLLLSLLFIWASATNMYYGITSPNIYLDYAPMAVPFYCDFIHGWFSHVNHIMIPLIAVGQFVIGVGMLLKDWWVKLACIGAIIFLVSISPLMVGSGFPFTVLVAWAAFIVFKRDKKDYLWRQDRIVEKARKAKVNSSAFYLSIIAGVLALVASMVGLIAHIYNDNNFVQNAWKANDFVTLAVVIPALGFVLFKYPKAKAQLLLAGVLSYLIYNYAFYLFGANFNVLFLVYVAIVSSSLFGLIALLSHIPIEQYQLEQNVGNRLISIYLVMIALMLIAVEVPPAINFAFTGSLPDIVTKTNHPTSVVYALDLPFIVPVSLLAGYWLWKKKQWGIVLSAIMLVKGAAYGLVLCAGTVMLKLKGIDNDPLLPFYVFITVGGVAGLIGLLRALKTPEYNDEAENLSAGTTVRIHVTKVANETAEVR